MEATPVQMVGEPLSLAKSSKPLERRPALCDDLWETLSMLCIGCQFEFHDHITGIRVVDSSTFKKQNLYRIELWFDDNSIKNQIETEFKDKLSIDTELHYKEHSTAVELKPKYINNYHNKKQFRNKTYNNNKN